MAEYTEEQKIKARNEALKFAVETLTVNRFQSTVARKSYVRDIKACLQKKGTETDKAISSQLSQSEIERWESFYESVISSKTPGDLRVAYLSGPNPENDIKVLTEHGILPENIWAFESDNATYTDAVMSALNSDFPFVKIYRGRIEQYLKILPFKFDIIYLDFCTSIAGDKTLSVVRDIFLYQKLSTLGVLITNFGFPSKAIEKNLEFRDRLMKLSCSYLYPKTFTEKFEMLGGGYRESAMCYSLTFENFIEIAKANEDNFYSQFITRVLFDLPGVIIPYQRLAHNTQLHSLFFKNFNSSSFDPEYEEDIEMCPDEHPLVASLLNRFEGDAEFEKTFDKVQRQLSVTNGEKKLSDVIKLVRYFIDERPQKGLHSDKLEKIKENWDITDKYLFCDVFMFHQLKDILVGQLTAPHFYNVDCTKRWVYQAKETPMFMDLVTYDECRYIFDWMPTLDMFEEGLENWDRQLSLRFAMDSVTKQRRWYNEEFFNGTAVVDQGTPTFEAKELKPRIQIT